MTALDGRDCFPVPIALVAVRVNVYKVRVDRPVSVIGRSLPVMLSAIVESSPHPIVRIPHP